MVWPGVLVVRENRGLNPYVEDVARRLAAENFRFRGRGGAVLRRPAAAADAARIRAPLLLHYAALDTRVNAGWPAYEEAHPGFLQPE